MIVTGLLNVQLVLVKLKSKTNIIKNFYITYFYDKQIILKNILLCNLNVCKQISGSLTSFLNHRVSKFTALGEKDFFFLKKNRHVLYSKLQTEFN